MARSLSWFSRHFTILVVLALLASFIGALMAVTTAGATISDSLQLVDEPQAGIGPFLRLIASAHSSIDLTMYELFDRRVEEALAGAASRGVDVRVLLNGGYYSERESTNTQAYRYLAGHHVDVRYTPTFYALTHQKTLTIDGRTAAIMTLNFDGLYSSTRDFAVIDSQTADVAAIVGAFDADWTSKREAASAGTGDLVWSPGAEDRVLAMITAAKRTIDLEDEEMDYAPATTALCAAARRGVNVRIVMTYESEWRSAFDELAGCGAHIRLYHGQSYYIHAKILDVDGAETLISSQNLSTGSLKYNRELGIVVSTPGILSQLGEDFDSDFQGGQTW